MIAFPNAKINLGLHILGKRSDGYHDLETIFYPIPLYDALELVPSERLGLASSGLSVPIEGNLCLKAFDILASDFDIRPIRFYLHKKIPIGAGLGGGSADAAFALRLMNDFFDLGLSTQQLEYYAAKLGADCSFFIKNQPAFAQGKGDVLSTVALDLSRYTIMLVCPPVFISTAEAFQSVRPSRRQEPMQALVQLPMQEWKTYLKNDFEPPMFERYPDLKQIKETLYQSGAVYASMSGSGSSIFGIFEKHAAMPSFKDKPYQIYTFNITG